MNNICEWINNLVKSFFDLWYGEEECNCECCIKKKSN